MALADRTSNEPTLLRSVYYRMCGQDVLLWTLAFIHKACTHETTVTANRTAKLAELLRELSVFRVEGDLSLDIRGIVDDSRRVQPGDLFVALTAW